MIRLMTTFNGKPAPGGLYDPTTATFYKSCRSLSGGQHPHRYDLGGLDSPVVERLKNLKCKKVVLEIPGATYEIPFEKFLEKGYPQKWSDTRFPHARWYCQARHWNSEHLVRLETPCKEEQSTPERKQSTLFESAELQSLAMSGRWN